MRTVTVPMSYFVAITCAFLLILNTQGLACTCKWVVFSVSVCVVTISQLMLVACYCRFPFLFSPLLFKRGLEVIGARRTKFHSLRSIFCVIQILLPASRSHKLSLSKRKRPSRSTSGCSAICDHSWSNDQNQPFEHLLVLRRVDILDAPSLPHRY